MGGTLRIPDELYGVAAVPPPIFRVIGHTIGGGTAATPYSNSTSSNSC
jgi:hypothetical protein